VDGTPFDVFGSVLTAGDLTRGGDWVSLLLGDELCFEELQDLSGEVTTGSGGNTQTQSFSIIFRGETASCGYKQGAQQLPIAATALSLSFS